MALSCIAASGVGSLIFIDDADDVTHDDATHTKGAMLEVVNVYLHIYV